MHSTLIITGTNRPDSYTSRVSDRLADILRLDSDIQHLSLEALNHWPWVEEGMYAGTLPGADWVRLQEEMLIPHKNWIWILPEYNGSFPGMVKLFIDILSVHRAGDTFADKKMGLIGVATGRAGNLRGMDHMTDILHHMNAEVMPFKLPISSVHMMWDEHGGVKPELESALHRFCDAYRKFTSK